MGQRPIENYTTSDEASAALAAGDVSLLLSLHQSIFGGYCMEGEDPDPGEGEDEGDGDEEDGEEEDDEEGEKPKAKSKSSIKALSDENARRRNEAKQLREDLAKRDKELKKFQDADKSETDKLIGERDELKETNEKLSGVNSRLALQNAFLLESTHDWHNPKAALKLLDLDGVQIDDEGEVTGMDKAIEKLAKDHPYLLKKADDDEESGAPRTPSGQPTGKPKKDSARAALEKKYRL